ncbi:MAG: dihydroorotate dehydrogenase electron transfer subunit [Fusobacteriaceae bacterium]|jgi:dihydroorotate dehydrogenase electron transfer subunit|nr:dihydroorotate dehydrogenase electron transfer subunit [Fusobacteriaceae bacterium]
MFLEDSAVLSNVNIGGGKYLLKIASQTAIKAAKAGQFFMIKCKSEYFTLRRPISLHYANTKTNILEFYYEVKGKGTKDLSSFEFGDKIEIHGPLGNGFSTNIVGKEILVVGGGMGIAPMKQLISILKGTNKITFVAGGRDFSAIKILESFDLEGISTFVTTDDGSIGLRGSVVSKVSSLLEEKKYDSIYVCGPHVIMDIIGKLAIEKNIFCEVSLESRMACGVKACVGCSILTTYGMKKVCHDGPVFDATSVINVRPIENTTACEISFPDNEEKKEQENKEEKNKEEKNKEQKIDNKKLEKKKIEKKKTDKKKKGVK